MVPTVGKIKRENWVETCLWIGRGLSADPVIGSREREGEERESREELGSSGPMVTKSPTRMAIVLCYLIAQNKQIIFSFGRQSSVRSFRARIKAQRIAIRAGVLGSLKNPYRMLLEGQCSGDVTAQGAGVWRGAAKAEWAWDLDDLLGLLLCSSQEQSGKVTALNPTLQAFHATANCWVS